MTPRDARSLAVRLYSLLLSFFPDDFDAELRRDALETFVDLRRGARCRGRLAALRVTAHSLRHGVGAVVALGAEWWWLSPDP